MLSQINNIQAPTTEHVCELRIRLVNQQTKQHISIRDLKAIDGSPEPGLESDTRANLRVVIRRLDLLCAHDLSTVSTVRYTRRTIHHRTEVIHSTGHLQSHRESASAAETPVEAGCTSHIVHAAYGHKSRPICIPGSACNWVCPRECPCALECR